MIMTLALVLAQDVDIVAPAFQLQQNKPCLSFKLKPGEGTALGVELLRAGVASWTDDQGTNLGTKDAKEFYGEASWGTQDSGADMVVRVMGKHAPAPGAKSMSIEGEFPVLVGLDFRQGEAKEVVLKPGASFDVGAFTFKISKVEKAKDSVDFKIQEILRVTFTFDVPRQLTGTEFLREFKLFGADGKEWKSARKNFQGSFKGGGEHRLTYAILPTDQPLTVKWAAYGKIETVVVPLKHSGPIGK